MGKYITPIQLRSINEMVILLETLKEIRGLKEIKYPDVYSGWKSPTLFNDLKKKGILLIGNPRKMSFYLVDGKIADKVIPIFRELTDEDQSDPKKIYLFYLGKGYKTNVDAYEFVGSTKNNPQSLNKFLQISIGHEEP
jgi:hypothetical protein